MKIWAKIVLGFGLAVFVLVLGLFIFDSSSDEQRERNWSWADQIFENGEGSAEEIESVEIFHRDLDDGRWKTYDDLKKFPDTWKLTGESQISLFIFALKNAPINYDANDILKFIDLSPSVVYHILCWNKDHKTVAGGQWIVFREYENTYSFVRTDDLVNSGWGSLRPNTALGVYLRSLPVK